MHELLYCRACSAELGSTARPFGLLFPTIFLRSDIRTIHEYIDERSQRVSSARSSERDDGQNLSLVDALQSSNTEKIENTIKCYYSIGFIVTLT